MYENKNLLLSFQKMGYLFYRSGVGFDTGDQSRWRHFMDFVHYRIGIVGL